MSVARYAAIAAVGLVRIYQVTLSPLRGFLFGASACCRYSPSCSCYAIESFRRHGLFGGGLLAVRRILRCHPWGGAGYDPVPESPTLKRS